MSGASQREREKMEASRKREMQTQAAEDRLCLQERERSLLEPVRYRLNRLPQTFLSSDAPSNPSQLHVR